MEADGNGDHGLTLATSDTARTEFNGTVGANSALGSLTTSAAGITAINGGIVGTTGEQIYQGMVTLGADAVLSSNASVTFDGTLNGGNTNSSLSINSDVTFNDTVGNTNSLGALSITGATSMNGNSIRTRGAQSYDGAVTLGANTALIIEPIIAPVINQNLMVSSSARATLATRNTLNSDALITFNSTLNGGIVIVV